MSEANNEPRPDRDAELRKRDAETQIALGLFIFVLSLPVLLGTIWADRFHAQIVNVIAGVVLLAIGAGLFWYGWRRRAR